MSVLNITAASTAGGGAYEEPLVACGVLEPLVACMGREANAVVQEQACLALGNIASAHSNIATRQRALELGVLDLLPRLRGSSSGRVARAAESTLEALMYSLTPASRRALDTRPSSGLAGGKRRIPRRASPLGGPPTP